MIKNIFATPIYITTIDNKDVVQQEIHKCLPDIEYEKPSFFDSYGNTFNITTLNKDIISSKQLANFELELHKNILLYCEQIGFVARDYSRISWFTRMLPGQLGHSHTHQFFDIGGVYYTKVPEGSGSIKFECTNQLETSLPFQNYAKSVSIEPEEGTLVLFPAWLRHSIDINNANTERVSLAFNVSFLNRI